MPLLQPPGRLRRPHLLLAQHVASRVGQPHLEANTTQGQRYLGVAPRVGQPHLEANTTQGQRYLGVAPRVGQPHLELADVVREGLDVGRVPI